MAWTFNRVREYMNGDLFGMTSDLTQFYDSGQG